jgi:hypothetical protein
MQYLFRYSPELRCKIWQRVSLEETLCVNKFENNTAQIFREYNVYEEIDFNRWTPVTMEEFNAAYITTMIDLGLLDILKSLGVDLSSKIQSFATTQPELKY